MEHIKVVIVVLALFSLLPVYNRQYKSSMRDDNDDSKPDNKS